MPPTITCRRRPTTRRFARPPLLFDRAFATFWDGTARTEVVARELELEPRPDDDQEEIPEEPPDVLGSPRQWSRDDVNRDKTLIGQWAGESPEMRRVLRELLTSLATRPSRRRRPARRGSRIDLRTGLVGRTMPVLSRFVLAALPLPPEFLTA